MAAWLTSKEGGRKLRNTYLTKELSIEGNVLRSAPAQELHLAQTTHTADTENASFNDLLHLRCAVEAHLAAKRGTAAFADPDSLFRQMQTKPVPDDRYSELSLSCVRGHMERRQLLGHLSVR